MTFNTNTKWPLAGIALLVLGGCTPAPPPTPVVDTAAIETGIRADETAWNKDWSDKDLAKITSHYADDAVVMVPGGPAMKGKTGIQDGLKPFMADPNIKLEFAAQRVEVSKSGDLATTQGAYSMTMTDAKTKKPTIEKGTYVTVYKKQADGTWKAIEDINTPDGTH